MANPFAVSTGYGLSHVRFPVAGWYDGGRRFYYVSEATGFAHLYTVAADGTDRRQLTSGKWEVLDVDLSPDEKTFYLRTNEPSPFEDQFNRILHKPKASLLRSISCRSELFGASLMLWSNRGRESP